MDAPKISVLIPMYNRKHYIEQCIDSALNQTFQENFDIIICDNHSTDGAAELVVEKYAAEISTGKIKFLRNERNMGGAFNTNRLFREATGKYVMILHSDDMFLPHALEHMYEVAEHFKADVVHESRFLITAPDGIIEKGAQLRINSHDQHQVDKPAVMSNEPIERFKEWYLSGTFMDAQYNIFSRKFLTENDLRFYDFGGNSLFALEWLMKAKVYVKTPTLCYICRNSPSQDTHSKFPPERVAKNISDYIKFSRYLDDYFDSEDFFKDSPELQYAVQSHFYEVGENFWILRNGIYKDGITPELHRAVKDAFRKYFGNDAALPTFLYHRINTLCFRKSSTMIVAPPPQ